MELLLGVGFVFLLVLGVWTWATAQQATSADAYIDDRRPEWRQDE